MTSRDFYKLSFHISRCNLADVAHRLSCTVNELFPWNQGFYCSVFIITYILDLLLDLYATIWGYMAVSRALCVSIHNEDSLALPQSSV
jgi:hypothetical protein